MENHSLISDVSQDPTPLLSREKQRQASVRLSSQQIVVRHHPLRSKSSRICLWQESHLCATDSHGQPNKNHPCYRLQELIEIAPCTEIKEIVQNFESSTTLRIRPSQQHSWPADLLPLGAWNSSVKANRKPHPRAPSYCRLPLPLVQANAARKDVRFFYVFFDPMSSSGYGDGGGDVDVHVKL